MILALLACRHAPPDAAALAAVPGFPMKADCPSEQAKFVEYSLAMAISVGAPLYNDGDHAGCYRMYLGTAVDLDERLTACPGVKERLGRAVREASTQQSYTDRAWTMRHGFDDVLEALEGGTKGL